ncbi:MAG: hypothetical protein K0R34_2478 [Herbinix sp.]|jgi:hypothetical protein|nr:hypothetical protein [Herbinix sp.]MDF2907157.1 hypothetical protein [Herbinix sp.]
MTVYEWIQELAQFNPDLVVNVDFTPSGDNERRADKIKFSRYGNEVCIECEE